LSEEEQRATGTTPELVRLSIGIEDVNDIIADLDQALTKSQRGGRRPAAPSAEAAPVAAAGR
jgi:hypothetical protein